MKKANTFRTRIFLSLLAIALFQIVAVIFIIDLTGTTQKLDESTLQIYKNAVYNRGESIQEQLKEWSNIIPYCEAVNEMINEYAIQQEKTVPELLKNGLSMEGLDKVLKNFARENGWYYLNQAGDINNSLAHVKTTGPEIWEATGGKVDYVVQLVGTGGTLSGLAKYFREKILM